MNRQTRRRIQREWDKIRVGRPCTRFVERNGLFTLPHTIYFQAVKIGDDLIGVYWISIFDYKKDFGYFERVVICQLVGCLFRSRCSVELGFIAERDLDNSEETDIHGLNCETY